LGLSVYETIKQRIVLLDIQPGSPISTRELADGLGVSITPVREALIRLEADGLIQRVPNSTPHVSDVHLHDLKDVLEARLLLIEQVARLAVQRIREDELDQMRDVLERMKRTRDRRELIRLDGVFHEVIYTATRNRTLSQLADLMRVHVMRLWYYVNNEHRYWDELISDREQLIGALSGGNVEATTEILKSHVEKFLDEVRAAAWG
jgi:DNA-binding GntR family transcriptional regulator